MGIILDHGKHKIDLKYRVKYIRARLFVSIIALILYLTVVFRKIHKRNV